MASDGARLHTSPVAASGIATVAGHLTHFFLNRICDHLKTVLKREKRLQNYNTLVLFKFV